MSRSLSAPILLLAGLAAVALAPADAHAEGRAAVARATLTAEPAAVRQALLEALESWGIQLDDPEVGIVKTAWVERLRGRQRLRGRVIAEYREDGYQTALSVKHLVELERSALRSTLASPAPTWREADGRHAIARDVVRSVERALGEDAAVPLSSLDGITRASGPPLRLQADGRDRVVSPDTARRINGLKDRRRSLVIEIRAADSRIQEALEGKDGSRDAASTQALVARKRTMQDEIVAIDREILALVLAE